MPSADAKSVKIVVYHQPGCPPCHSAMQFLEREGIPFEGKDITTDSQALREIIALGSNSTPTITVGDEVMIGFRKDELLEMIRSARAAGAADADA